MFCYLSFCGLLAHIVVDGSPVFSEADPLLEFEEVWGDASIPHWEHESQLSAVQKRTALEEFESQSRALSSAARSGSASFASHISPHPFFDSDDKSLGPSPLDTSISGNSVGDRNDAKHSTASRKGKAVYRKRLRDESTLAEPPTVLTGAAMTKTLTNEDKKVCLEEMIIAGELGHRHVNPRILERLSHVDPEAIQRYQANVFANAKIPGWLHDILMSRAADNDPEYIHIMKEAAAAEALPGNRPVRRSISTAVKDWMRFCIEPLRAAGASDHLEICHAYRTAGGTRCSRLVGAQLRLFLESELAMIDSRPESKPRALPRRVVPPVMKGGKPPPTAVPHGRERVEAIDHGGEASVKSQEERRACLQVMVDHPLALPNELAEYVTNWFPHLSKLKVVSYINNLAAGARISKKHHDYLLERKALEFTDAMLGDLRKLLGSAKPTHLRWGIKSHSVIWIKYCIAPWLANPLIANSFCHSDGRPDSMRLSLSQRQALYADLLAEM